MNKDLAVAILHHIIKNTTEKDIAKNKELMPQLDSFKQYLASDNFSPSEAKAQTEKIISQCPKYLRRELHSLFFPTAEQEKLINQRKSKLPPTDYKSTNIRSPWQGGSTGLKK